jgi:hypothetical protein
MIEYLAGDLIQLLPWLWMREGSVFMHETLASLVARALEGSPRPLEFYLREQSRLPGPRANLALV